MTNQVNSQPLSSDAVCHVFALGEPTAPLARVYGGLVNRMWHLETNRRRFAVKELNREWDNSDYLASYERAFRIEMAAQAAGIPMPRPIPVPESGACLAELADGTDRPPTVRVHEWVDGQNIQHAEVDPAIAGWIGARLAQIHGLGLVAEQSLTEILWVWGPEHWRALAGRAAERDAGWAETLRGLLPLVAEMEAVVIAARADATPVVLAHRDVNFKNVLVALDGQLLLVDWDAAGPCGAAHEVACAALDWAGVRLQAPRPDLAHALIDGYRAAGGEFDAPNRTVFAYFLQGFLNWLEFCARRSLGDYLQDPEDRKLAEQRMRHPLANLARFARSLDAWLPLPA